MSRFRPTRSELLLTGAFSVASFASLAMLLSRGHELTGAENQVGADQLQYLSWIVSAASDWTIRSLWSIPPQSESAFLHPGFLLSGLFVRAGVNPIVAFELWKPVAIVAVAISFAAYVRRLLPAGGPRTAALALALFGMSPAGALLGWGELHGGFRGQLEFVAGEVLPVGWMWGYMMTALAVALLVFSLLAAERSLDRSAGSKWQALGTLGALGCSWLQPWQGAELLAAVVFCDLLRPSTAGRLSSIRTHLPMLIASVAPLAYYRWLAASEDVWRIAAEANNSVDLWSAGVWAASFIVWLPALPAFARRADDWQELALRAVPVIMVLEYAAIATTKSATFPFHSIQGIGLFLGILAVKGSRQVLGAEWWRRRVPLAAGLCVLMCVPGVLHRVNLMRLEIHLSAQPYFLEEGESAALDALARSGKDGGVLAPIKAALVVPSRTGRPVWVGELSWTPDFRERVALAERLFKGQLTAIHARRLVRSSGAVVLYADCGHRFDLRKQLGPLVSSVEDFGCARLYMLARPGKAMAQ